MSHRLLPYWISAALVLGAVAILLALGRTPICTCGYVALWSGDPNSSENSQHLTDWYTPSHILHGLIFYVALWWALPSMGIGWRLTIATLVEVAWEILENSPVIIERYRAVTISLGYTGDSVINSFMDIVAMFVGFWLARVLPVWASIAILIGAEVLTGIVIRDGLALNVLMLVFPLDFVLDWQAGG
jgi:hypothetical protein